MCFQDSAPLSSLKWKNRILLIHENKALYNDIVKLQDGIEDRDMIILHIDSQNLISYPVKIDLPVQSTRDYFKFKTGKSESLLIGKDGGVKLREPSPDIEKIFALIDGMPMRRSEMKAKSKG